jgi:hypothetical protein
MDDEIDKLNNTIAKEEEKVFAGRKEFAGFAGGPPPLREI